MAHGCVIIFAFLDKSTKKFISMYGKMSKHLIKSVSENGSHFLMNVSESVVHIEIVLPLNSRHSDLA